MPKVFVTSLLLTVFAMIILTACGNTTVPAPNQAAAAGPTTAAAAGSVSFANNVLPIFESRCFSCHGGDKTEKGLDLKTYNSVMLGSQRGAVIVAGSADSSSLFNAVSSGKMPKRGPQLTPQQLGLIKNWINSGALNN
jgi:uncharacterized membrane protein